MSPDAIRSLREAWRWARLHPRAAIALHGGMLIALICLVLIQRDGYASAVVSAVLRVLTGCLLMLHQVLLEPSRKNYPDGRPRLRVALFVAGVVLVGNGIELLIRAVAQFHRHPPASSLELSLALFARETLGLEKIMRSWLPERTQRRIQQLLFLASCRNRDLTTKERERNMAVVGRVRPLTQSVSEPAHASVIPAALAEIAMRGSGDTVVGPEEQAPVTFGDALRDVFKLQPMAEDDPIIPAALRDV